jgi:NAD(P)-dependent dehydrogenase (short-subunit alcohol dehydrogenase family)
MGMMDGKVVVVTGAGRGVGRGVALLMAEEGAQVVVNDIGAALDGSGGEQTPAQEVGTEIEKAGGEAVANYDSVSEWSSAEKIIQCALDTYGRIDAVVNNAGILRDVIFHKMTEGDWDAVVNVMLKGTFNVSRHAADHFRKQESGAFVHMTSTAGLIGAIGQANYAAAKLGIVGLSNTIARDMEKYRIRSNCLAPSGWTRMIASIPTDTPAQQKRVAQRMSVKAEMNAPLTVFLCSDAAASVSGQVFYVRKNELFLFSQHRPIRGVHRSEGWTPATIAEHALPSFKPNLTPLDRTVTVFPYDAI